MTDEDRSSIHDPDKHWLKKVTLRHWAWIHFKLAGLAWAIVLFLKTPEPVQGALGPVLIAICGVVAFGAVVSVIGIIMSDQQTSNSEIVGVGVELSGLIFMSAGPASYLGIQVFLATTLPTGDQRLSLIFLCYWLLAAFVCRAVMVVPRYTQARKIVRNLKAKGLS